MNNPTMPKRAISVVLSTTLACSLAPFATSAYAFASDSQTSSSFANTAETSQQADSSSAATSASKTSSAVVVNEERKISESSAVVSSSSQATTHETDTIDVVSASVNVNATDAAATVLSQNGLSYEVNEEDSQTVSFIGFAGQAPEGALEIPAQVKNGANTYTVVGMKNCWGGVAILR